LEQKGNDLFYNGRALPLPADIKVADIAAVSIGALTRRWLIGLTLKDGQNYRGRIFYFNGQKFIELITPEPIKSAYFGLFGFGGEEDDFLLIYGAYRGIAYRVRGDKLTDISKFFGIRLLGNGFKAEIIKAVYRNNVNWYIYSSTLDRPRLIKLWQNQTTEIVGETIPTDFLTGTEKSAAFKLLKAKADEIIILSNIKNNNREADWRIFTDRGFKNSQFAYLTTIPIMVGGQSQIIIKKIISSDLRLDSGSKSLVKFLFSEDGQKWRDVPLGEDLDFVTPRIGRYFLKVIFSALSDKFYSPFVGSILFDYDYQK
jgi:hypothetical protein